MNRYFATLFLTALSAAPLSSTVPAEDVRRLSFFHTHTSAELSVTYYADGEYNAAALRDLNHFLRDFRTGDEIEMDPAVFDILFDIQQRTGSNGVYQVISAYRSPATNEMLRSSSGGVARNSQHLQGNAIDVRLTDVDTADLRDVALSLKHGGVGYYRESDLSDTRLANNRFYSLIS